jgi:hypothetical protein
VLPIRGRAFRVELYLDGWLNAFEHRCSVDPSGTACRAAERTFVSQGCTVGCH